MIAFILGGVVVLGVARAVARRRFRRHGFRYGYGYGGWGHRHGRGRGGVGDGDGFDLGLDDDEYESRRFGGWGLRGLWRALDLRPEQRAQLKEARGEIKAVGATLKQELSGLRDNVADALRAESFDEEIMGAATVKIDNAVDTVRKAVISMVARVHTTLDAEQRAILADRLSRSRTPRAALGL